MEFSRSKPKSTVNENIVPMINVVFLMLIFFLMSAQIAPPPPVEINAPLSQFEVDPTGELDLFVTAQGVVFFGEVTGSEAMARLAQSGTETVKLHTDAEFPAQELAKLLSKLADLGVTTVELVTRPAR